MQVTMRKRTNDETTNCLLHYRNIGLQTKQRVSPPLPTSVEAVAFSRDLPGRDVYQDVSLPGESVTVQKPIDKKKLEILLQHELHQGGYNMNVPCLVQAARGTEVVARRRKRPRADGRSARGEGRERPRCSPARPLPLSSPRPSVAIK